MHWGVNRGREGGWPSLLPNNWPIAGLSLADQAEAEPKTGPKARRTGEKGGVAEPLARHSPMCGAKTH